jgi:hypothetical protein
MAGLFSSGEQDLLGNIMTQRQQANQALGSGYGKYGGIVQAAAGMADVGADAMTGGMIGSSDPRMQQLQGAKAIFSKVAQETGEVDSSAFYEKLAQALSAQYPEQAQKAADKAMEIKKAEFAMKPKAEKPLLSNLGKLLTEQAKYEVGTAGYNAYQGAIDKETTAVQSKDPSVGTKAELTSQAKFGKTFSELNATQKAEVFKMVQESEKDSLGSGLTALAEAITKKTGEGVGKDVAEAVSPVVLQGKENTLAALQRAQELLTKNDGIYTGGLASAKMAASKYTPFGSQKKLENTEKYLAYVSTTVIPLLKEFGGNDSNEELKFLQRLVGGEITLEEETLKEIIASAITKTERGITRSQEAAKAASKGEMPSTAIQPQNLGARPTPIGVGESTSVNGVTIKRVK